MSTEFFVCTSEQARWADQQAIHSCRIPSLILMEHAALGCAEHIFNHTQPHESGLIMCGPGNNGADGMAIARLLHERQRKVFVVAPLKEQIRKDERIQYEMLDCHPIPVYEMNDPAVNELFSQCGYIVDALFGSGLSRPVDGAWLELIRKINKAQAKVFSVDIPSGLNGTSGTPCPEAVHASYTFALDCIKQGEIFPSGAPYCQTIVPVPIGIPSFLHAGDPVLLDESFIRSLIPKRSAFGYKGMFGKALMIGGSTQMPGAISMASSACFRSGIGLLSVFVPESICSILQTKSNLIMSVPALEEKGRFAAKSAAQLRSIAGRYTVFSIGNGMQKTEVAEELLHVVLTTASPVIVDADALRALGRHLEWLKGRDALTIVTPHIGEMSDLTGIPVSQIEADPFQAVRDFCRAYPRCVVVLKSCFTLISQGEKMFVLHHPNDALSKGGSGDVLAGIVTGLCGWFENGLNAALCAAYIHSLAADTSCPVSFSAEELIDNLGTVFERLEK